MQPDKPEYQLLSTIWETKQRIPRPVNYRIAQKKTDLPSIAELEKTYGSFEQAVQSFFDTYHAIHGYREIPDYLLGALVTHAKIIREKRGARPYLRLTSKDEPQLSLISTFLDRVSIYPASKDKPTWYFRCYDDDLILAYEHLCESSLPFRSTVDFVRGYIDTHSHIHASTLGRTCLTLTGVLVPQCHDFLVGLGAINNKVYHQSIGTSRMNLHTKSIRKIREKLYPPGCVCNEEIRARLYRV